MHSQSLLWCPRAADAEQPAATLLPSFNSSPGVARNIPRETCAEAPVCAKALCHLTVTIRGIWGRWRSVTTRVASTAARRGSFWAFKVPGKCRDRALCFLSCFHCLLAWCRQHESCCSAAWQQLQSADAITRTALLHQTRGSHGCDGPCCSLWLIFSWGCLGRG